MLTTNTFPGFGFPFSSCGLQLRQAKSYHYSLAWDKKLLLPEQIEQGACVVCLADYFCLGLGFFCFWSLSCQHIQSLAKVIICLITQEPCCQVYIRDCSQAADRAALWQPWILRENCSGKEQRSGMRSMGSCLPLCSAAASGGLSSGCSESTFYVRYCCSSSPSLFRLRWVSFFQGDSLNFESTFASTLLCNQFSSFLHCEVLAVGTALRNELLRKAFQFSENTATKTYELCVFPR